jgi:hypothetical protein
MVKIQGRKYKIFQIPYFAKQLQSKGNDEQKQIAGLDAADPGGGDDLGNVLWI